LDPSKPEVSFQLLRISGLQTPERVVGQDATSITTKQSGLFQGSISFVASPQAITAEAMFNFTQTKATTYNNDGTYFSGQVNTGLGVRATFGGSKVGVTGSVGPGLGTEIGKTPPLEF
jgi:hypothetical protein